MKTSKTLTIVLTKELIKEMIKDSTSFKVSKGNSKTKITKYETSKFIFHIESGTDRNYSTVYYLKKVTNKENKLTANVLVSDPSESKDLAAVITVCHNEQVRMEKIKQEKIKELEFKQQELQAEIDALTFFSSKDV